MMAAHKPPKWTRQSAMSYLAHSPTYRAIEGKSRVAKLPDMSTAQLKRFASKVQFGELAGVPPHSLAELRGHLATEHHAGRGPKKGYEQYRPPTQPHYGTREFRNPDYHFTVTVTRSEALAVRALARAAGANLQVSLGITFYDEGGNLQQTALFWRGGWNAARLLDAAGYSLRYVFRGGHRVGIAQQRSGTPGLRQFVLDYLNNGLSYPVRYIKFFEVFAHSSPQPQSRVRRGPVELPQGRETGRWQQLGLMDVGGS